VQGGTKEATNKALTRREQQATSSPLIRQDSAAATNPVVSSKLFPGRIWLNPPLPTVHCCANLFRCPFMLSPFLLFSVNSFMKPVTSAPFCLTRSSHTSPYHSLSFPHLFSAALVVFCPWLVPKVSVISTIRLVLLRLRFSAPLLFLLHPAWVGVSFIESLLVFSNNRKKSLRYARSCLS
jgi:hypothetical protein